MEKECNYCKNLFTTKFKSLLKTRKYCSKKCYGLSIKNNTPWNKGLKNWMSEEGKQSMINSKIGKPRTQEIRNKISKSNIGKKQPIHQILSRSGPNASNWIKDRSKLKKSNRKDHDYAYKNWMLNVKKRDSWKCKLLNEQCNGRLESHHIFNWIDYPELRYDINNGITLCHFHHPFGREEEKRMIPIFQELLTVSEV
jgi:hypothetical protein